MSATKHYAHIVKWRDSACFSGWQSIDGDHTVATITSVGWITRRTPTAVTLTTCISEHGSVREAVTIPREAITKMTKLKNYVLGN